MTTSTGRSSDSRRAGRSIGQWLLGLLIVLALAASVLMVFSDNLSVPGTLAVIAALWAAVIGAILVTRFRKQAESAEAKSRDLRLVYELQLEREIAARRQYELDVETTIRKEVAAESGTELESLKEQVVSLRASLERLLGASLPDDQAALPNEKLRELASGLGGLGPAQEPAPGAPRVESDFAAHDDGIVAARDFAQTAPSSDDGRHQYSTLDPNEMTEVIPIVTDDPLAAPVDAGDAGSPERPTAASPAGYVDDAPTDEWAAQQAHHAGAPIPGTPIPGAPIPGTPTPAPSRAQGRHEGDASGVGGRRRRGDGPVPERRSPGSSAAPAEPPAYHAPAPAAGDDGENAATATGAADSGSLDNAHSNGLPVSELLRQLRQTESSSGGRRRRRD